MDKLYYSISEVSKLIDEEQYILRYWEKEFKQLNPKKNSAGNRKYTKSDLDVLRKIKILLRDEKLSLKGAKEKMNGVTKSYSDSLFNIEESTIFQDTHKVDDIPKEIKSLDRTIKLSLSDAEELKSLLKNALNELK